MTAPTTPATVAGVPSVRAAGRALLALALAAALTTGVLITLSALIHSSA